MTMDEAKHRKIAKGYAYEPVSGPVAASRYPDFGGNRQREQHSAKYSDEMVPTPHSSQDQWDTRGVKRKAEYANGGGHWQEGGRGEYVDEDSKAMKKKAKREAVLQELAKLERLKVQVHLKEQALLSGGLKRDDDSRDAWPQNGGAAPRPMHPPPQPQLSRQASDGKEKRTPKANVLYANEYVSAPTGQDHLAAHALGKGAPNGKAAKRPAGGDARAQKVEKERAKRRAAIWKKVLTMHNRRLMGDRLNSWYFAEPVDPVKLNIPTYFDEIKHPMDLGTVLKRLQREEYRSAEQYAGDVRLTFRNAMTFNGEQNNVHKAAKFLLDKFDREWWPPIMQDVLQDREQTRIEEEALADAEWQAQKAPKAPPAAKKAPKAAKAPPAAPASSKQSGGGYAQQAAHRPPPPKPKAKPMSMEEKRDLSIALSDMGAELLSGIVEIIKERHADLMSNDEELELDIDALDDVTLWELKRYVEQKAGEEAESRPPAQEGDGSTNHDREPVTPKGGSSEEVPSKQKKAKGQKSSSTSSSSGSESSGSGSSGSSSGSGSETEADETKQKKAAASGDRRGGPPASAKSPGKAPKQGERGQPSSASKAQLPLAPAPAAPEAIPEVEMTEEQREKHRRALELRAKYTDTIIQARTSDLGPKAPVSRSAEEIRRAQEERRQRELAEAARIRQEAEAARAAERRAREAAAAEEKRKIEQLREAERLRLQQFNRGVELDSHDIEKEYQKIKTLSPQDESRSRSPHVSPPSPEAEAEEDSPGGVMEQLGLVIRHDDDEATDDEYDEEEEANGAADSDGEEDAAMEEGEGVVPADEAEMEEGEI